MAYLPHQSLPHQQQSQFFPNPYGQSTAPSSSFVHPHASAAQSYQDQRQQHLPNQNHTVPDDPFKKPYLPPQRPEPRHTQQQYMQNGRLLFPSEENMLITLLRPSPTQSPPASFPYSQQQPTSTAAIAPNNLSFSPPQAHKQFKQPAPSNSSYPSSSSMTTTVIPVTSSAQSTPTSEAPSQSHDPVPQASKLSPLDQQRVDALLYVNHLLIQEVQVLQKAGLKATPQSPQQVNPSQSSISSPQTSAPPQTKVEGTSSTDVTATSPGSVTNTTPTTANQTITTPTTGTPTQPTHTPTNMEKFVEYMRRLQANIVWLVATSDEQKQKSRPPYPQILEPPPASWLGSDDKTEGEDSKSEGLRESYAKLRELWPDWKPGMKPQPQGQQQPQSQVQPQPQS
ncbi:hypothetical protein MMC28_003626 [Mycoblastus sanguinarius]|nr:hypothetical protein [Mycoblastus sanguinarius]